MQQIMPGGDTKRPWQVIFDRSIPRGSKRFAAACVLRLLKANHEPFRGQAFRIDAFRLLDTLASEVYRHAHVTTSEQTYEKQTALTDLVKTLESELEVLSHSITALEGFDEFRRSILNKLNSQLCKVLVSPFLPAGFNTARMNEAFVSVDAYLQSEKDESLSAYEKGKDQLDALVREAEEYGTTYSRLAVADPLRRVAKLLDDRFGAARVAKPADVSVRPKDKNYPFHEVGQKFPLQIIVQNSGPGDALNVYLLVNASDLKIEKPDYYVGHLDLSSVGIEIPVEVSAPTQKVVFEVEVEWTTFDNQSSRREFIFELSGQPSTISWHKLAVQDPYSLEPATTDEDLVGRDDILNQLLILARGRSVGSSYVYGQKRVGKTSIVKTLKDRLERADPTIYSVVYLEAGDYVHPKATATIEQLGIKLCCAIKDCDSRLETLPIPTFDGALSPIADFLQQVARLAPERKFLFVLDEFDELPLELYKRGPVADALFLTVRSVSAKLAFGFVLVGGEKMELILSCQGDALNKFLPLRVDYFDRERHWTDFQNLVRQPVAEWMEVSEDALSVLYTQSAGNPYFAKVICRSLFRTMVSRHDNHITDREATEAVLYALETVSANSFQHFWEDGILDTGEAVEDVSMRRRKVLLGVADSLGPKMTASQDDIVAHAKPYDVSESETIAELRDLSRRQVLIPMDRSFRCKVGLFGEWLRTNGAQQIVTTFADLDAVLARRKIEEDLYVRPDEIVALVKSWGVYKGQRIGEERVRAWLRQFGDNKNQRLMFKLLEHLRFYGGDSVRAKLREAHGIVTRGLLRPLDGKRKRGDILVSYLDRPDKSGAHHARLYVDENSIYFENVLERGSIHQALLDGSDVRALVFVDDFVGTGKSAGDYIGALAEESGELIRKRNVRLVFVGICGFQDAPDRIEAAAQRVGLDVSVHLCDPLDISAKTFSPRSQIYPDATEREMARDLAETIGKKLVHRNPLGFGDGEALVVFESGCPNNTLPILWAETADWTALFKRL